MNAILVPPLGRPLKGRARVPRSKPHTQRAILLSLLTNAPSLIVRPDWSSESQCLYEVVRQFGLEVASHDAAHLAVTGAGRSLNRPKTPVWTDGSAFAFRTAAALACPAPGKTG